MKNAPIGVIDSGVGGLTVARAILDQLPNEPIKYVGDTANGPYGPKPIAQVRQFSLAIMDKLVADGVKALVIACNTASAATLRDARERYDVPVVEVIGPAVRRAVSVTRNKKVGVIGTRATVESGAYADAFAAAPDIELISKACPRFVEFVENGITSGKELLEVAQEYLQELKEAHIDTVVLGCTHFPLLSGAIGYTLGPEVAIVSSADETARDLFQVLVSRDLLREENSPPPVHEFLATGNTELFAPLAKRFLGPEVAHVKKLS
jgi:glutamate racemase